MEAMLGQLVEQSAVLGTLTLIAITAGKYVLPLMREFNLGQKEIAIAMRGQAEAIREQSGWLRYLIQRQNGQVPERPDA